MKYSPQTSPSSGLDDLLQSRLRELLAKIGSAPVEVIEAELLELTSLVDKFKSSDELLEQLLDPKTSEPSRKEIRDALKVQLRLVGQNRSEAQRLHMKSEQLLERSVQLIAKASRQVYKLRNDTSPYAPELCRYCKGFGKRDGVPCPACKGTRTVLVHQPPLQCPRCRGTGRPGSSDFLIDSRNVCSVCWGRGWALTADS